MGRSPHALLLHPELSFSSSTERLFATLGALREQGCKLTLATQPGSRGVATREAGCDVQYLELPRSPSRAPLAWRRTRLALRRAEPDLLHVTDGSLAALGARAAAATHKRYVLEIHETVADPVPHDPDALAAVLVPSEAHREAAVNRGQLPRDRVRVVPHAPAPVEAPPRTERPADALPVVGCAGGLDGEHDPATFLDAVRLLEHQGVRARYALLGEGPLDQAMRRRVRRGGLAERVTVGVPTTREVGSALAALDVHVSCRRSGPGWLAAAALVQGVPSVFAATGEAFQLVEDERTGFLVEPGDPVRLAEIVRMLLEDPARARRVGEAGRDLALERHPPARFALSVAETHALALGTAFVAP